MSWRFEIIATRLCQLTPVSFAATAFVFASTALAVEYDVYLIGGQSNAVGLGSADELDPAQRTNAGVLLYHSDTLSSTGGADRLITLEPAARGNMFGPEIALGNRLDALMPERNILLIKHAEGSTGLSQTLDGTNNWHPGASNMDTANFGDQYATFVNTVDGGLRALADAGHTYNIKGMLWQQGERDSTTNATATAYGTNLKQLIGRVREQFSAPDMLFTYGTILNGLDRVEEPVLRAEQFAVDQFSGSPLSTPNAALITLDDTSFRTNDVIHFDTNGQLELGNRAAERLFLKQRVPEAGEASVVSVDFARNLDEQGTLASNVSGRLYFGGGPAPGSGPYWNTASVPLDGPNSTIQPGARFDGLIASDGVSPSDIGVELTRGFFRSFNGGDATNALQSDRIFTNAAQGVDFTTGVITLDGLDTDSVYDITLFTTGAFDTTYTINGVSLSDAIGIGNAVDADNDGSLDFIDGVTHVTFAGVGPDANGEISVSIAGNGSDVGLISAIQIAEVPEPTTAVLGITAWIMLPRRQGRH